MANFAVIGSNFGDEGKGLITDFIASKNLPCTVVRFNGGAQAGHTVTTPDGTRHVFGHIGSGAFTGAWTHLSKFFIVNPILFRKELRTLSLKIPGLRRITCSPDCIVTTPYDMMINQLAEKLRANRHGSCGVGINETIERHKIRPITVLTLVDSLSSILNTMRDPEWVKLRLIANGIENPVIPDEYIKYLKDPIIVSQFIQDCEFFISHVGIKSDSRVQNNNIIFEGAQGLLLDQDKSEYWPHVTSSKTGLDNVLELAKEMNLTELDITFVTRWYVTRHGNGKFSREVRKYEDIGLNPLMKDKTNVPNPWQGTLRYGFLDLWELANSIGIELGKLYKMGPETLTFSTTVAVTCLDQAPEIIPMFNRGFTQFSELGLLALINKFVNKVIASHGSTRNDVKEYNDS